MISRAQLISIMPLAEDRVGRWLQPLNDAMEAFGINTWMREAAFLAQIGHESAQLRYTAEIWSPKQVKAQARYERDWSAEWPTTLTDWTNRLAFALGNSERGDGEKFKGHGLIQITGRANHLRCSLAVYGDERLIDSPHLLEEPEAASRSACWFWKDHKLNDLADQGPPSFREMTRRINGGLTGIQDREEYYDRAMSVLKP